MEGARALAAEQNEHLSRLVALQELLVEPWVIAALVVLAVVSGIAFSLAFYAAFRARQNWGPYGETVRFVLAGHTQGQKLNNEAAADLYRSAVLGLCHKVFGAGSTAKRASGSGGGGGVVAAAPAAVAQEVDETLRAYNASVGLSVTLSFAVRNEALCGADTVVPVSFDGQGACLGVDLDLARCIVSVTPGSAAAYAGLAPGDQLDRLNGKGIAELTTEQIQAQLSAPGRASFNRQVQGATDSEAVFICSRCGCGNRADGEQCNFFRCFSCQTTAICWQFLVAAPAGGGPRQSRWRTRRVGPELGHAHLKDLTWEASGLDGVVRHPTGFGSAGEAPSDCQHHGQVGATCGMAAVNNLLTNAGKVGVDNQYMVEVSTRLGEAEAVLRDGAQSVQEAGEEHHVSELYAASSGGHYDVQTLQTAFAESGFHMWYVPQQQLQNPTALFASSTGDAEGEDVVGYVVHRKDPMNPRQDHWFVVRKHGKEPRARFLMQDSLFDQVFQLTRVEAHQLLLSLPTGALFAVSQPRTAAMP